MGAEEVAELVLEQYQQQLPGKPDGLLHEPLPYVLQLGFAFADQMLDAKLQKMLAKMMSKLQMWLETTQAQT